MLLANNIRSTASLIVVFFALFSGLAMASDDKLAFEPGQVWSFDGATPETSKVIVGAITHHEGVEIVSIAVTNAPISADKSKLQTISHLPFAADTLRKSVITLTGTSGIPAGFDEGYKTWQAAFGAAEAGYFTIPVAEVVEILRQQLGSTKE